MSIARRSFCILTTSFLAACSMVPPYIQPVAPVPAALPQGASYPALPAGDTKVDGLGWKSFFVDPRLQQVIALALD